MKITPNLTFEDNAREAFGFYAEVLGADQLNLITFGDMPDAPVGPDWKDKIAHAWMQVGDQAIMGSDNPPGVCADAGGSGTETRRAPPTQTAIALHFDTADRARQIFDRLSEDGLVQMPFAATSWSPGFGMARDRFGKDWLVNTFPQERG